MKFYENKSHKKCVKSCDAILKKHPNHGETLSMKGLALNALGESEKAHEFCKKGLMANMKTHVTWHVYGLLYRAEKNYAQAIKSYKQALKRSPDNMQILRDITVLQMQTRDIAGCVSSRNKLLQNKSNNKQNWLGFAVAKHLNKEHATALEVAKSYKETLAKEDREECNYENGELALFENKVIESMGDPNKVIEHLEASKAIITDKLEWKQRMSKFYIKVGRFDDATLLLRALMAENPENYMYHRGLQSCILKNGDFIDGDGTDLPVLHATLTDDQTSTLLEMYDVLALQQPRCSAHRLIPLMFTTGDAYSSRAHKLLRSSITKVKDTLFSVLKPIYKREIQAGSSFKLDDGIAYLLECEKSLEANNAFPESSEDKQAPTAILCTHLFLAQHLDLKGDHERALEYIEKAIAHTPTFVDLYTVKGKILKHTGDLYEAASACDYGRRLDLADRCINCKTTKYLFRAARIEEAERIVVLFSKSEGEYQASLFDMQCMWYECTAGEAYLAAKNYKMALKKFGSVEVHWGTIQDDQIDYHSYCMRKSTLRSYMQMIKLEDTLGIHSFYFKSTLGMVRTYLAMHEDPAPATAEQIAYDAMTKEQQRNYRRKKAKEKAKKESAAAKKKKNRSRAKVPEPDEEQLYNVDKPLMEAWKHVQTLQKRNPDRLETYVAQIDVAIARKEPMLALDGLVRACKLAPEAGVKHPQLLPRALRLFKTVEDGLVALKPDVKTEFDAKRQTLLGADSLSAIAKAYVEAYASSSPACSHSALVSACEAAVETDTTLTDLVVSTLCGAFSSKSVTEITAKSAVRAHKILENIAR